ncbi:hypothetical protein BC826DRAFT_1179676 [Russula brevipes]|nr:hypothetical protein BC826DRAFT_1179676 [Russula brevipes]
MSKGECRTERGGRVAGDGRLGRKTSGSRRERGQEERREAEDGERNRGGSGGEARDGRQTRTAGGWRAVGGRWKTRGEEESENEGEGEGGGRDCRDRERGRTSRTSGGSRFTRTDAAVLWLREEGKRVGRMQGRERNFGHSNELEKKKGNRLA